MSNPASFRAEAQCQRVCAACGSAGPFDAHHVITKNRLKRAGLTSLVWDPRNALRLCVTNRCHERYTNGTYKIETGDLTNDNICFVWAALGVAGQNYLERHYTGPDRRFTLHPEGGCALCQLQK